MLKAETKSFPLENQERNCKITMFRKIPLQMLPAQMKQSPNLRKSRTSLQILPSTHYLAQKFLRAYFYTALPEPVKLYWHAQLLEKQKFLSIQSLALTLLKCLLALVRLVYVTYLRKLKQMHQQLSSLMKSMLSVANVAQVWVADTMNANKHSINC